MKRDAIRDVYEPRRRYNRDLPAHTGEAGYIVAFFSGVVLTIVTMLLASGVR